MQLQKFDIPYKKKKKKKMWNVERDEKIIFVRR